MFQWMTTNYPGKFDRFLQYREARATKRSMVQLGIWDSYVKYCDQHVDFLNPTLDTGTTFALNYNIVKDFESNDPDGTLVLPSCARFATWIVVCIDGSLSDTVQVIWSCSVNPALPV
eukprot:3227047-Alexandrium_andersonii.AAC.1